MKKILSLLWTITLIGTNTASLVACNTTQYNEKELADLKEKNNITTKDGILEWIAPQEKPFNKVDNKWYYVVWRGDENNDWFLTKFNNNIVLNSISLKRKLDHYKEHDLFISPNGLVINRYDFTYEPSKWWEINSNYFKFVYRWNDEEQNLPKLDIDENGNIKVK